MESLFGSGGGGGGSSSALIVKTARPAASPTLPGPFTETPVQPPAACDAGARTSVIARAARSAGTERRMGKVSSVGAPPFRDGSHRQVVRVITKSLGAEPADQRADAPVAARGGGVVVVGEVLGVQARVARAQRVGLGELLAQRV